MQRKNAAEQHSRDEEEKQSLKTTNRELAEKLDVISKQIEELQKQSLSEKENNQKLSEENANLRLAKWKLPRYFIAILFLVICVVFFILYFTCSNWDYNYAVKISDYIDSLEGIKQDIAKFVLFIVHGGLFLLSINALISLKMIEKEEEIKHWFLKLIKYLINK